MQALILIIVGAAIAVALSKMLSKKKQVQAKKQERDRVVTGANVTNDITGVGKGGVLKLPVFGNNRMPIETYVVTRHRYNDDGNQPWYELVCQHGARELLVEWYRDGSKVVVTGGYEDENPSLVDLGLTEKDLIQFDEDEEGTFEWDGETWHFDEATTVTYFENDGRDSERYYSWNFENDEGTRSVSVEKWHGERKFPVYHLWTIDARKVEVFDAGEGVG